LVIFKILNLKKVFSFECHTSLCPIQSGFIIKFKKKKKEFPNEKLYKY
jgi:hypothetical protein